jgi:DNA-binding NtrC family response regulator
MAARIALVGLAEGTALAVRAALGAGAVRVCRRGAVPAGAALVITEDLRDAAGSAAPVLVLVERGERVDAAAGNGTFEVLEKPFDAGVLRERVRGILESSTSRGGPGPSASPAGGAILRWLAEPLVDAAAARLLAAARQAGGPVLVVGEPGTGTERVAVELARSWNDGGAPVVWRESEPLDVAASRLSDARQALWVPALDRRSPADQADLEHFLAIDAQRGVVATGSDEPEPGVKAGTLSPSLAMLLSRISVRLAPLRERRRELEGVAEAVARDVARRSGIARVTFTDRAKAELQAYAWPYNLVELESVLTRTLAASASGPAVEIDELQLAPLHLAPLFSTDEGLEADDVPAAGDGVAPRRAVVVALGDVVAARAAANLPPAAAVPEAAEESAIESVLAGFAHDLRNPMATIKTFASLAATQEGQDSDTAELARLAAIECNRVDEQLELLQRYSEIEPAEPEDVELVEILVDAVDAADATYVLAINARRALKVRCDAALARFVADAIVGECRARLAPGARAGDATADVDAASGALTITIPTGVAAVDRLDRWVGGKRVPWRLALARDAARRAGGSLDLEVEDGLLRLSWRLSAAGGQAARGGQAASSGSPAAEPARPADRRR